MSEYENYLGRARARAIELVNENITGWNAQDVSDGADELMGRGFGYLGGFGATARVVANTLRKVRPIASFDEAKNLTLALVIANRELATTYTVTDAEPHFCAHCGGRFSQPNNRRTMYTPHTTVFDPRDA